MSALCKYVCISGSKMLMYQNVECICKYITNIFDSGKIFDNSHRSFTAPTTAISITKGS